MEGESSFQNLLSSQELGFFEGETPVFFDNYQNHSSIQSLSNFYVPNTESQCENLQELNYAGKGKKSQKDWSFEEEKKCYKFLGVFMIQNPFQFRSWNQRNSHVYPHMSKKIGSKTIGQCKSKLSALKKKYTKNNTNGRVISSLKQLVLLKLKEYMESDGECQQIYNSILKEHEKFDKQLERQMRTALQDYQEIDKLSTVFSIVLDFGEKKKEKNKAIKTKSRKFSRKTSKGSSFGDDLDYFNLEQIKEFEVTELKTSTSLTVSKDHQQML